MTSDKKLANELLKQNGLEPDKISDQNHQQTQQMLAKEVKSARRLSRASKKFWLVVAIWPGIAFLIAIIYPVVARRGSAVAIGGLIILGWYVLIPCAIICTIIAHLALRTATMSQIQESLKNISEELKRQSRDS